MIRFMSIARKHCPWASIVAALAVAALVAGCGGSSPGPGPRDATPPTVRVTSYTQLLSATGGSATINSTATDDTGISKVEVKVTAPGGHVTTLTAATKGGNIYSASYSASANPGTTKMTYEFTVYASDGAGNTGSDGKFKFEVPSAEAPPGPPPFSIF